MPAPPSVTVHENTPCPWDPEALGCADPVAGEVWLAPGSGRFTRWHELGHVFDEWVLTDAERAWFTPRLGFKTPRSWWLTDDEVRADADAVASFGLPAPPAELFADAYAACALGYSPDARRVKRHGKWVLAATWVDGYGYMPSGRTHRRVCNAIAMIGVARITRP